MSSTNCDSRNAPISRPTWRAAGLRYHSLNFFYRKKFGTKVWKVSLDAGCAVRTATARWPPWAASSATRKASAPAGGLGLPFDRRTTRRGDPPAEPRGMPPSGSWPTSSPAPTPTARSTGCGWLYEEALAHPEVVGLAIGTRPDCVRRGGPRPAGRTGRADLGGGRVRPANDPRPDARPGSTAATTTTPFSTPTGGPGSRNLDIGVHVILGLPGESRDDMLATARELARLEIHSVKLHNLYAVRNTRLADQVAAGRGPASRVAGIRRLRGRFSGRSARRTCVIDRLCGDAPPEYLVGPAWCLDKAAVRSAVEAEFRRRGTCRGCKAVNAGDE